MFLTAKGTALGTVMFIVAAIVYVVARMYAVSASTPHPPHTSVGISVHIIYGWTFRNPLFWIALVICCALASRWWR